MKQLFLASLLLALIPAASAQEHPATQPAGQQERAAASQPSVPEPSAPYQEAVELGMSLQFDDETGRPWSAWGEPDRWDSAAAAKLVEAHQDKLQDLRRILATQPFLAPEPQGFDDPGPPMMAWKHLAQLLEMQARLEFEDGRATEALASLQTILLFGSKVQEAEGQLISCLIGFTIESIGLEAIPFVLGSEALQAEFLLAMAQGIGARGSSGRALAAALELENRMMSKLIDDLASGKYQGMVEDPLGLSAYGLVGSYSFDAEATKELMSRPYREFAANSQVYYAKRKPVDMSDFEPPETTLGQVGMALAPNSIGRVLASIAVPNLDRMPRYRARYQTMREMARTALALRAFQLKNGHLPKALEELTPDFLSQIPRDEFEGNPLGWDAEKKTLQPVLQETELEENEDLLFQLPF